MNKNILKNIKNDFRSFEQIIDFYSLHKQKSMEQINFSLSGWFSANVCSMLGAVVDKLQEPFSFNNVMIEPGDAENILKRNGFLAFFGYSKEPDYYGTTIPYLVLSPKDDRYFYDYVTNKFLNKSDLPEMSSLLKKKIAESIYEIFINAKMHSGTKKIFVCGQYFPNKKKIEFMITDTGIGIKNVVNKRFSASLTAVQAIKWAVKDGNTTKEGVSGGLGLSLLYEFIRKNKGRVQIISNEGFWEMNKENIMAKVFKNEFPGTVVNISVRTDDMHSYRLSEEVPINIF